MSVTTAITVAGHVSVPTRDLLQPSAWPSLNRWSLSVLLRLGSARCGDTLGVTLEGGCCWHHVGGDEGPRLKPGTPG